MSHTISAFEALPQTGYCRAHQIIQFIPIGLSTWWRWVENGKAPKGIKLGPKTTVWRCEDIHKLVDELAMGE